MISTADLIRKQRFSELTQDHPSVGHIAWENDYEWYRSSNNICRAHRTDAIALNTGNRMGRQEFTVREVANYPELYRHLGDAFIQKCQKEVYGLVEYGDFVRIHDAFPASWEELEKKVLQCPDILENLFEDGTGNYAVASDGYFSTEQKTDGPGRYYFLKGCYNPDNPKSYAMTLKKLESIHGGEWEELCNIKKMQLKRSIDQVF